MPSYFDLLNILFRYNAIKQRVSALLLLKLLTVSDRMSGITFFHIRAEFLIRSLSCLSDTVWMNVLNKPAIAGSSLLADAPCARLADFNVIIRRRFSVVLANIVFSLLFAHVAVGFSLICFTNHCHCFCRGSYLFHFLVNFLSLLVQKEWQT